MKKSSLWAGVYLLAAAYAPLSLAQVDAPQEALELPQVLTFLDSKLFDAKLSRELDKNGGRVEVDISGRIPLSAIPPRLDRWMTKVGEHGSVELREGGTRTRTLFGVIPMIFSAFQAMSEERMLAPATQYNATLIYKKDQHGDTLLERIVFVRKAP